MKNKPLVRSRKLKPCKKTMSLVMLQAFLRDLDELFEGNGLSLVLEAQGSSLMIRLIKAEDADFNPSDWVNLVDLPLANSDK